MPVPTHKRRDRKPVPVYRGGKYREPEPPEPLTPDDSQANAQFLISCSGCALLVLSVFAGWRVFVATLSLALIGLILVLIVGRTRGGTPSGP